MPPIRGVSAQLRRRRTARKVEEEQQQARAAVKFSDEMTNILSEEDELEDVEPQRVEVEPGLSYTVQASKVDEYQKTLYRLQPSEQTVADRKPLTKEEELGQHTVSVVPAFTGQIKHRSIEKLEYVTRQFYAELGFNQMRTREFWLTMFTLILCFWIRLYTHYFGQWLFLQAIRVPVSQFIFAAITVDLNYQATLLLAEEEVGVVCFGPIAVMIIFALLILAAWISKSIMVSFGIKK